MYSFTIRQELRIFKIVIILFLKESFENSMLFWEFYVNFISIKTIC